MTGLNFITSANIQIESIQRCRVGRWIALDNLSQIHFERNRASAIICSVDQKPLFRLFLAGPSEPGGWDAMPTQFFGGSINPISTWGKILPTTLLLAPRSFPKLWNQVSSLDHFVVQNSGDFLCWKYKEIVCFYVSNLRPQSKLYIPSTLNIALIQWHIQLNVCAIR